MSVETQELLAVARARLAHRPGDFERFEHALMFDGLAGGNMTLRLLILKAPPPATALAALNPGEAARQKQARLVAIVDGWAEKQPCHLSAGVTPLPVPLLPPEQGYVQQSAATKQNQPEAAAPAPMVADNESMAREWTVTKPQRYHGYTAPLYRLLAAAHREGKSRPTARDVVEAWRTDKPSEIAKVLPDGFDYYDAKGNEKPADLDAVRAAIGRMTTGR